MAKLARKTKPALSRSDKALKKRAVHTKATTIPAKKAINRSHLPKRRSPRRPIEPALVVSNRLHFDLNYSPAYKNGRGGKQVTAVLGPGLADLARSGWTNAKGEALTKLQEAQEHYRGKINLVAGHLLNARFGGVGDDPRNLTILSASGNHNHQAFDNEVAKAVEELAKLYNVMRQGNMAVSRLTYGIQVQISVSEKTWGNQGVDRYICDHLVCVAHIVGHLPGFSKLDPIRRTWAKDHIENIKAHLKRANGFNVNGRIVQNTK